MFYQEVCKPEELKGTLFTKENGAEGPGFGSSTGPNTLVHAAKSSAAKYLSNTVGGVGSFTPYPHYTISTRIINSGKA